MKTFLFIYNSIANKNLNFSYNIKKLQLKQFIAVKLNIYIINFSFKNKLKGILNFKFLFFVIYLLNKDL